jgi:hypothetical protein
VYFIMQNNWHSDQRYVKRRQHLLMEEAEQNRLAKLSQPRGRILRIYAPVMVRFGSVLTLWGQQLQTRYGELPNLPGERLVLASDNVDSSGSC